MSCFEVQILEPSGTILEIESCAGENAHNVIIEQTSSAANLTISQCMALLPSDINDIIIGQIDSHLTAGSGISLTQQSGLLRISATGLQPSGNYSIVGHQHIISDISGLQIALDNKQPSGIYASGIHNHVSLDITDFNTSVSGLLPVTDIIGGANIAVTNSGSIYTINVSGQLGLTAEQVDDRVSNLLVAGSGITLNYNDGNDTLIINTSGLQPSGNYSIVGHTHVSANISDFDSSVSGLIPVKNILSGNGINVTSSFGNYTVAITGNFGLTSEEVDDRVSNLLIAGNYITLNYNDNNNTLTINTSGLQPSGLYASGVHYHSSADITNFNSGVSGLLPVKNILSGTGVSVSNTSGIFTINATGSGIAADQAKALVTTVFNKTGSPIPKMTAVYINGGQGDLPTVSPAIATSDMTSAGTYGLTYETIPNMESGLVIVFGALTGLDTDQFNPTAPQGDANGSVLYLSPYVSGTLTLTKPSAPNHIVAIGTIVRTHQNEGVIEVRVQNGFELEELHNVAISGASNGQFLQYNSTSGLWVPSSSGNFTTLQVNETGVVASSGGNSGYLSKFTSSNTIDNSIIYQSGNRIGINTTTPSGYLDIAGDVYVRGTGNNLGTIYIKSSASTDTSLKLRSDSQGNLFLDAGAYIKVGNQDGTAMVQGYTGPVTIGHISNSNNNQNIIFNPRATERARLTHDGNFGIGITSPSGRLHVIGSGIFSSGIVFGDNTLQTTAYVSGQAVAAPHSVSHQINGSDSIPIIIATASGITSDQHDYLLPTADIVRISGDATRSISSMVAVSGQIRTLTNVGLYDIRLLNESASGTITNRIKTSTGAHIVVAPNDSISLFYDNTTQRWRTPGVVKSTNTAQLSVYEFTRSSAPPDAIGSLGSYTWSLPVGAKLVEIFMIGPGGGGASGRRGASATNRYGGGGGGSGGSVLTTIDASLIQTPITMSIGAGGAGGAAVTTNDTNGNNGGNGSATTTLTFNNAVNTLFSAYVGLGATGGTNAAGTGGTFVSNNASTFRGSAGQNAALSNLTTTVPGDRAVNGPVGIPGAAGGSISTGDVIFTPGSVTNNAPYFSFNLGQAGANTSGGAASITAAGGSGSNAVSYGYGGCGGGASANGFNSGAGGNGGDGYIRITVWY